MLHGARCAVRLATYNIRQVLVAVGELTPQATPLVRALMEGTKGLRDELLQEQAADALARLLQVRRE